MVLSTTASRPKIELIKSMKKFMKKRASVGLFFSVNFMSRSYLKYHPIVAVSARVIMPSFSA